MSVVGVDVYTRGGVRHVWFDPRLSVLEAATCVAGCSGYYVRPDSLFAVAVDNVVLDYADPVSRLKGEVGHVALVEVGRTP